MNSMRNELDEVTRGRPRDTLVQVARNPGDPNDKRSRSTTQRNSGVPALVMVLGVRSRQEEKEEPHRERRVFVC